MTWIKGLSNFFASRSAVKICEMHKIALLSTAHDFNRKTAVKGANKLHKLKS